MIEALREVLGDTGAVSFQLLGEDLMILPGAALARAARRYEAELASLPEVLRGPFEAEQAALLRDTHVFLRRHNRSLHGRVRGYLELARRIRFEYPWPVAAILGLCQVHSGMQSNRIYGLLGAAAARLPIVGFDVLERLVDVTDDVLRRTNRSIFADSVPTVLFGMRAHALRRAGEAALAEALLDGPLPLFFDEQNRRLARALAHGLSIADASRRFEHLAALTLEHFGREQAIFTYHLGGQGKDDSKFLRRFATIKHVPAPVIERSARGARLVFRDFTLPEGFDMRDHAARVEAFGRAFVVSVTQTREEYEVAARWVEKRNALLR